MDGDLDRYGPNFPLLHGKKEKKIPFFVLNPALEDFFFVTGDQLEGIDEAGGLVERIPSHHHKGGFRAQDPHP